MCPPLKILVFDEGGSIDTITFNQQVELQAKILEKSLLYVESLIYLNEAYIQYDINLIGQAALH